MVDVHLFASRDAASLAAADRIVELLEARLDRENDASLVVSGGTTPGKCFQQLSQVEIDWHRVRVVLSDERWVPNDHKDSNERLVRETLIKDAAKGASVLSVYQADLSVDERCDAIQKEMPPSGFACSMVGMGADGHFASLFPDADSLEAGLNEDNQRFYMPVRTSASPHPRVSMTLASILKSDEILLLFFGDEKHAVFEEAMAGNAAYPITALLAQKKVPVALYWAP